MSTLIHLPGFIHPAVVGTVVKVWRMTGHSVEAADPLVDILLEKDYILTVLAPGSGKVLRERAVGASVKAGDWVSHVGSEATPTHPIFIAYRRADAEGHAGRLDDMLAHEFGRAQVFRDVPSLNLGNYVQSIRDRLDRAEALVVVIGPHWLDVAGVDGKRRIDDPDDLHREEIRRALQRGIVVIPVLVGGARMPPADALPDDIRELSLMQAVEVSDRRWEYDTQELARTDPGVGSVTSASRVRCAGSGRPQSRVALDRRRSV